MMTQYKDRTRARCGKCGFRIRGKNHDQGPHHLHVAESNYQNPRRKYAPKKY